MARPWLLLVPGLVLLAALPSPTGAVPGQDLAEYIVQMPPSFPMVRAGHETAQIPIQVYRDCAGDPMASGTSVRLQFAVLSPSAWVSETWFDPPTVGPTEPGPCVSSFAFVGSTVLHAQLSPEAPALVVQNLTFRVSIQETSPMSSDERSLEAVAKVAARAEASFEVTTASGNSPVQDVRAGRPARFLVEVRNDGNVPLLVHLALGVVQGTQAKDVRVHPNSFLLREPGEPGDRVMVEITALIPGDAERGEMIHVPVTFRGELVVDGQTWARATERITVVARVQSSDTSVLLGGPPWLAALVVWLVLSALLSVVALAWNLRWTQR